MAWTSIDTVRCVRCAVFTPTDDILYTTSGDAYCTTCGAPPVSMRRPVSPIAVSTARAHLKKNPVFVAAAAVAAVVASFFVAACASQL
jgi:hypothetical protein